MPDRQHFDTRTLSNGITVFSHPHKVPFVQIRVLIPVGSAHSHPGNPGGCFGIAHLLEHMITADSNKSRSAKQPLTKLVGQTGGEFNAWTYNFFTEFYLDLPQPVSQTMIKEFIRAIFHPELNSDELALQRSIIENEKGLDNYFPGHDPLSNYYFTRWMQITQVSKEQIFGTDRSLTSITPKHLEDFHHFYRSTDCLVMVGGQTNNLNLIEELARINTHSTKPTEKWTPAGWSSRRDQTQSFAEINTPRVIWGGIGEISARELIGLRVLLSLLTDEDNGILNQWLRHELGWSYGCTATHWFDRDHLAWYITIPLTTTQQAKQVKKELDTKVTQAIADKNLLKQHLKQMQRAQCFAFETLNERLRSAAQELMDLGVVITEKQYREYLKEFTSPTAIREIYNTFRHPDRSGTLLALPKPK